MNVERGTAVGGHEAESLVYSASPASLYLYDVSYWTLEQYEEARARGLV